MTPALRMPCSCLCLLALCCAPSLLYAHPIPDDNHHRAIAVQLVADPASDTLRVRIKYRLEEDQWTAVLKDTELLAGGFDWKTKSDSVSDKFAMFAERLGPVLAHGLQVSVDGAPVALKCSSARYLPTDENEKKLDHLRFEFLLEGQAELNKERIHSIAIHEGNFVKDANGKPDTGRIQLFFFTAEFLVFTEKRVPSAALRERPPEELTEEEYASLRDISTGFELSDSGISGGNAEEEPSTPIGTRSDSSPLLKLFFESQAGLLLACLIAFGLGALHALTPGHGKTLVAAYLVGERGTIWHACILGLTTTLTHTGAVLVLAVVLSFAPSSMGPQVEKTLGIVMGLVIAGLGMWLLLRRLGGQADHVHLGGHAHSHEHNGNHLHHHEHGHLHVAPDGVSWVGLILLGVQGGLVPCWDAVVMLLSALALNMLRLAVPLLLAFSAGLAVVLVTIGVLVVCAKGFAGSRWGDSRLFRALPVMSAGFVTCLGLIVCYRALHS